MVDWWFFRRPSNSRPIKSGNVFKKEIANDIANDLVQLHEIEID